VNVPSIAANVPSIAANVPSIFPKNSTFGEKRREFCAAILMLYLGSGLYRTDMQRLCDSTGPCEGEKQLMLF
ncbi:MAG: hypothetical protein LBK65_07835, partial [Tannerellaceae bacterium]|nr:hypothetical protein [Tannerellaceae bacterium]